MQSDVIVNVKDISNQDTVVPDTSADTPNTGYLGVGDNVGSDINASCGQLRREKIKENQK